MLRSHRPFTLIASATLVSWLAHAGAQERPDESELFGAPPADPNGAPAATPPTASQPAEDDAGVVEPAAAPGQPTAVTAAAADSGERAEASRDDAILGADAAPMFDEPFAPEDPLSIGGQLYLRAQTRILEGVGVEESLFNFPTLLDVYFDARPNDRVRGYVLGRMTYDPSASGARLSLSATEAASGSASLSSLVGAPRTGPRVQLDQLWLRFDIDHTVFVTAGKQHVRWGTARIWSPADFLHIQRRNPLEVFDARTGTTMLKLHLPIESRAWNFYAYALAEGPEGVPTLEQLGAAARAELVFGLTEVGLGAFVQKGTEPKFAADLSTGLGDFDVSMEVALRNREDSDRVGFDRSENDPADRFPVVRSTGYRPQVVGGLSYSIKYNDNDIFTIAAEYFYNPLGYASSEVYPGLLVPRTNPLRDPATYFYLGQHYAALVLAAPAPFSLDLHTFSLSTLANLSDRSFVTQLSYSLTVLTHLRFEAYIGAHYGRPSGEFRLRIELADELTIPATLVDAGIALRLAI
jgi:hypothetical protein